MAPQAVLDVCGAVPEERIKQVTVRSGQVWVK